MRNHLTGSQIEYYLNPTSGNRLNIMKEEFYNQWTNPLLVFQAVGGSLLGYGAMTSGAAPAAARTVTNTQSSLARTVVRNVDVAMEHSAARTAVGNMDVVVENGSIRIIDATTGEPKFPSTVAPRVLTAREIKNARQRGVYQAKSAERELIQSGHPGTANQGGLTWPERKQIAETGQYPSDIRWHHINDVKRNPMLADEPNNVIPSRGGDAGHVQNYHPNGGTRGGSSGPLLDRDALINQHLNGGGQ